MKLTVSEDYIMIDDRFEVLSSAPLNGGYTRCKKIVNLNVDGEKPENKNRTIRDTFGEKLDLDVSQLNDVVGFMTGADVEKYYRDSFVVNEGKIDVLITAGIGSSLDGDDHTNTINVIVSTDINISQTGMANLFIVISEAKSSAMRKLEITRKGEIVTGTPTDAIAVAKTTKDGSEIKYTGVATEIGEEIYKSVEKGVLSALEKQEGISVDRPVIDKLREHNVTIDKMVESAFKLYEEGKPEETDKEELKELLKRRCEDENIQYLLETSMYLGRRARYQGKKDDAYIVADELIGIQIAEYIGGKNALFNFIRYDKEKPGILTELDEKDIFLDDAVGGLIAGCMTRLYEEK
ncbi:phosphatidylglycerophosphatase A [Methanonatronarchaeum sp. AMET6-2]|uniref:phosphatidylglycerophosphatase A n=1 Tax=Methanonatronarchaeum sp. AMET6-2 TaxID=2933293 RepID=UPI0011FE15F5|nr:phosphatidylglycerophosphatase A [Methanonatronarchaeum sp. AMET6-2]RZN63244.1 MAG: hypothetical protein EF811_00830 [Methanonatronarchaeia archaeon]UOY10495.1 phosphatidylglycerophosphatase A [Methanonatronarchaeum sp. AMET6-2]